MSNIFSRNNIKFIKTIYFKEFIDYNIFIKLRSNTMEKFLDFNKFNKIHFIGIGGVSMSSLAMMLKEKGKEITGSDSTESSNTNMLKDNGITVYNNHEAKNAVGTELIVYTAAIPDSNPELVYAKENNIPIMERAVLLGALMSSYSNSIAVSGTHGKTTTTSMIASILLDAKTDPTIHIGAHFNRVNGNYKTGHSNFSIYEACEYVNSFLHFYPETAIILNIDADHLDFFKTLENIQNSFLSFTENVHQNGTIIINGDDYNCRYILEKSNRKIVTFGMESSNNCYPFNIRTIDGKPCFDVNYCGEVINDVQLSVYGEHNILNALASICTMKKYNIDNQYILKGLLNFTGANRRFEIKKYYNGAPIIDDYAHHPTEIKATISSAKNAGYKKITVIFQSHTYTRTKFLMNEFAKELSQADKVILTDIYSAREINTVGVNIIDLKNMIPNSQYISKFDDIAQYIKQNATKDDIFILMGAGNINTVADMI